MTGRTYKQSLCVHCSVNRSQHPHAGVPKPAAVFPFAWRKNSKEGAEASDTHLLGKWFQAPHNTLADPRILNATKCNAADTQAICLVAPLWFRLDISMLGSLMQCNTRGRRRGVQGEGGLEARVCCVCSCAPKVEMIEQESAIKVCQRFMCAMTRPNGLQWCMQADGPLHTHGGNIQKLYMTVVLCLRMRLKDKLHVG